MAPWRANYEFVIEIHTSATPSPSDQPLALHTRFKMPRIVLALLALVAGTTAFGVATPKLPSLAVTKQRSAGVLMAEKLPRGWRKVKSQSRPGQFSYLNTKTGLRYDRMPTRAADFYDDEADTTAKPLWQWKDEEKEYKDMGYRSAQEAAGFAPDGGDLANMGGIYYVAFIPFLLFFIAYVFGGVGELYGSTGNF